MVHVEKCLIYVKGPTQSAKYLILKVADEVGLIKGIFLVLSSQKTTALLKFMI